MKNRSQACLHALLIAFILLPASLSVTTSIPVTAEATDASASSLSGTASGALSGAVTTSLSGDILSKGPGVAQIVPPNDDPTPAGDGFMRQAEEQASQADGAQTIFPGVSVSKSELKQGETFKVRVGVQTTPGGSTGQMSVKFDECTAKLFLESRNDTLSVYSTFLAVPALLPPGKYEISVIGLTGSGVAPAITTVTVHDAKFPIQRMTLPKDKDNFNASPGEKEAMARAKKTVSDEQLWQGRFKSPVPGAGLSSRFGRRRIVNGKLIPDYFHSGLDFRGARGTPIHATARGKVIVAKTGWRLHGNTTVLDHGHGILSIYIHQTSLAVKVGDEVEAGQKIGTIGSTGRASGPHLHFCVYVNGTAANPEDWLAKQF